MSDFLDANQILSQLDGRLSGPVHVVVCGGLVIEVQYGGPGSRDIDSLDALSGELKDAVEKIADEKGLDATWFNDHAVKFFEFDKTLPAGWRERALDEDPVFSGAHLKLYPLCRRDLILTKLFGVFTRGGWDILKDVAALTNNIGVSESELEDCVNDLHRMLRGSRWEKTKAQISKIIKENIR